MTNGRPIKQLKLNEYERQKLELIASRPKSSQRDALRATIILAYATGIPNQEVAQKLRINQDTVRKWRSRFFEVTTRWFGGSTSQWGSSNNWWQKSWGDCHKDIPNCAQRENTLEHTDHGQRSRSTWWHSYHLESVWTQAPPHKDVQSFQRPYVSGEYERHHWALYGSSRKGDRSLCRWKKPHKLWSAVNPFFQWAWECQSVKHIIIFGMNHIAFCCLERSRRRSHWEMPQQASAAGVFEIL